MHDARAVGVQVSANALALTTTNRPFAAPKTIACLTVFRRELPTIRTRVPLNTLPVGGYHNVFSALPFPLHLTQKTGRRAALQVAGRGHLARPLTSTASNPPRSCFRRQGTRPSPGS
eukprot:794025-Pleurochrysis_carterae.AAC.1